MSTNTTNDRRNKILDYSKKHILDNNLDLKPCPYCGSDNIVLLKHYQWSTAYGKENCFLKIQCNNCGAGTMDIPTGRIEPDEHDEIISNIIADRWNRRADKP